METVKSMQSLETVSSIKRVELLVITKNEELLKVAKDLVNFFLFHAEFFKTIGEIETAFYLGSPPLMILLSFQEEENVRERKGMVGKLHEMFPRAHLVVVRSEGESLEDGNSLRDVGANYLISSQEISVNCKLYYLAAVLVRGTYLPVPVSDFFPNTQLNFNAYHKLLLNQKFLPVIFSGFTISDKKFRELEPSKQIYIRRENLENYRKYVEAYHDRSGSALKKRCRVVMMNLLGLFSDVILLLSLDSEIGKEDLVKEKISHFVQSSVELGEYLQGCPDVWNVIAQSLNFKFCQYERGVYILAYAVYISLKAQLAPVSEVVMTVLLADLGILDLPAECYKNILERSERKLTTPDLGFFQNHPLASLKRMMLRKVELPEEVQRAIACTHERNDLQGFPSQVPADQIPLTAKLVFFCEVMDRRLRAAEEEGTLPHDYVRKQVWEEERSSLGRFNADFLDKIKKVLIA
ncbi:MAG: HD domain-containing phosphohydrolase [Pseudobdellovibrionaceae bacterium]